MQKLRKLYEGKAKEVYCTEDSNLYIVSYKDSATAFNGVKKDEIVGKGAINNQITNLLMQVLEKHHIPTHFVQELNPAESVVKRVEIIPLEVIVRNIASGSLCKRLGVEEGTKMEPVILEYCYKDDSLGDPMVNESHIFALRLARAEELEFIADFALRINTVLQDFFEKLGITLVDFKLEFGRDEKGRVILADEISPDTCRLWDKQSAKKLDKDRFRNDLGDVIEAYEEVLRRVRQ